MGSITRYSALKRFQEAFGEKIKKHYEEQLIGKTIVSMSELSFNHWKSADVAFSDEQVFTVHFGWSSEWEQHEEKEELEDDDISSEEYFNQCLKGKEITHIQIGYERDDELYVFAFVDEYAALEISIGYDPESGELYNNDIITEEEFNEYQQSK